MKGVAGGNPDQPLAQPIPQAFGAPGQSSAPPQMQSTYNSAHNGPDVNWNAIAVPQTVMSAAITAGMTSPADGAKIIMDYKKQQSDQSRQDYYQSPEYLGKKASSEAVAQGTTKDAFTAHDAAQSAVSDIGIIDQGKKLLNSGMYTGRFADYQANFNAALEKSGITSADPKVSNTQAYAALMGNRVGNIIKQFGSGTGLSDKDREYAESIAGGKITVDEQAIRKMLAIGEKIDRVTIDRYNKNYYPVLKNAAPNDPYKIDAPGTTGIPDSAVSYLKSNPSLAAAFDQKYGQGASSQVLGQ
jgi:hypothetical protein